MNNGALSSERAVTTTATGGGGGGDYFPSFCCPLSSFNPVGFAFPSLGPLLPSWCPSQASVIPSCAEGIVVRGREGEGKERGENQIDLSVAAVGRW